jgi:ataxia telangiectasia mutated family protein
MFAERQYHAVLKSPDALRWKLYVDRKTNEIESLNKEISRTQIVAVKEDLKSEQKRAQRLLQTDSELFRKHNDLQEILLQQALEMHSRCLETSDEFNDDSAIRLCSLWFANFDDESILDTVSNALDRTPSGKLVFLAVSFISLVSPYRIFRELSSTKLQLASQAQQLATCPGIKKFSNA